MYSIHWTDNHNATSNFAFFIHEITLVARSSWYETIIKLPTNLSIHHDLSDLFADDLFIHHVEEIADLFSTVWNYTSLFTCGCCWGRQLLVMKVVFPGWLPSCQIKGRFGGSSRDLAMLLQVSPATQLHCWVSLVIFFSQLLHYVLDVFVSNYALLA